MSPSINQLLTCIANWVQIKDKLLDSKVFIEVVTIVLKFSRLMSSAKFSAEAGLDLRSLPRIFDVKSTVKKDKNAYEIIMKQFLMRQDPIVSKKLL